METDSQDASIRPPKVIILPGHAADMSSATFCILEEDHTLGNALRYMIMKNPQVQFCGYSQPHPSEDKIHLRIQMYDGLSAYEALQSGLASLEDCILAIRDEYKSQLAKGDFERVEDPDLATIKADAIEAAKIKQREARLAARPATAARSKSNSKPPVAA
ncbi:uncharacterized protein L969DRAFT_86776 [Mixia osmundae IAM 14324]|uniref:uncharacterized protein n=1 Tax=Mixia osmundae (strain CBS 9802 / IAM 14324 / JCM 22182 / KY 12970) TaxID=764103 RepID=UPI0004A55807|nr:uncharacterized protein L969DRAFT_86776 [Mixia osmundae IAM 14324]KEI40150.1 hypothetical protein L969DRAFT_86776 [Mixia osmundae IAM 14324]